MLLPKKNVKTEFLIPSESDIPGWIIADEIINKDSSNINEYNSAYADKGVISYSKCRYRDIDNNEIYIDLNIIKFSTILNAYGFFSSTAGFEEWLPYENGNDFKSDLFYFKVIGLLKR